MPLFTAINNTQEINLSNEWTESPKFNSKDRLVDGQGCYVDGSYQGSKYQLVSKKERSFSYLERIGQISLGILAVIFSGGLALCSDSAWNLFAKDKETLRFGILFEPSLPVTPSISPKNKAAVTIQKCFRGHLTRKHFLPQNLYPQYQSLCKKADDSMPRAHGGKTTVYLPKELPQVVLKQSGRKDCITRFHQMEDVRSIIDSQKSTHLIIPKARLCEEFLVEERLPINVDSFHNMGLYLSQPQLFDEAVRELTRLFSQATLTDLVSWQLHPLSNLQGVGDFVRYDNLPLYLVEKNGKKEGRIGLIDLEHLVMKPQDNGLMILVRIFPLHLNLILEEAEKLNMKIDQKELKDTAVKGKTYLQVGFTDHLNWIQQHGLSTQPLQVSEKRVAELTNIVEKELLKLNTGVNDLFDRRRSTDRPPKDFLLTPLEKTAKKLAVAIVPVILNNLKKQTGKELSNLSSQNPSEAELVNARSLTIKRPKLYKGVKDLIEKSSTAAFNELFFESKHIADQLLYVIMEELVKGGEIFFFNPAYYTQGLEICWVRF